MATSEIAYPSDEILARGTSFAALPNETIQSMDKLWIDVKASANSSGGNSWILYAGIGVVIVAVIVIFALRKRRRNSMYD